jgi:hypothetical protein
MSFDVAGRSFPGFTSVHADRSVRTCTGLRGHIAQIRNRAPLTVPLLLAVHRIGDLLHVDFIG